jgi:type II secretory pathway predicted ATPase ExeA
MSIEEIRSHFGFTKMPFGKDLAPSMLHRHRGHQEALARISFLVQEQAIGVLTGEVGSGKTVAARAAISELEPSRYSVIYLANPSIGARGLYAEIVSRLGGEPRFFKSALIAQASDLLAKEAAELGRRVVVIVDESHLLDAGQLEEMRLLTNAEMDSASPFALLFLGQPSLRARLCLGSFAALDQRVTLRYALPPWSGRNVELREPSPRTVWPVRHALFRRRPLEHSPGRSGPSSGGEQPRAPSSRAAYANRSAIVDEKAARQAVTEMDAE